jgi:hypothetical protein
MKFGQTRNNWCVVIPGFLTVALLLLEDHTKYRTNKDKDINTHK